MSARIALASFGLFFFALAGTPAPAQNLGFHGWGPRGGLSVAPDQALVGAHFDLGEIVSSLRLQPSIEAGFGDDRRLVVVTLPVLYRFDTGRRFTPYAGGGAGIAWVDVDEDACPPGVDCAGSDIDAAPVGIGGIEFPLRQGNDIFFEIHAAGRDLPDVKLVIGWQFSV